jgi:hypothetical protein
MSSGTIWASSVYNVNDAREFRYAIDLIESRVHERLKGEHGSRNEAYGELLESLNSVRQGVQTFVASFSEEGDLLSQWQAYSGTNGGYAIEVSPDHFSHSERSGFTLVKCIYDERDQILLADAVIDVISAAVTDATTSQTNEEAARKALTAAAAMKHPGFTHESEWRLIKTRVLEWNTDGEALFRSGRNGLVPYIKAPLASGAEKFRPSSIRVGPNTDMDAATIAVRTLLDSLGLLTPFGRHVPVDESKTPYRP